MLAGDGSGDAIGHHLIRLRLVVVGHEPHGHQDVLESLLAVGRMHDQVAVRIARHLVAAQPFHRGVHRPLGVRGSVRQVDLVALDRPACQITRVVRHERVGREGLHPAQQAGVHALRRLDELIVERVGELARRRRPLDPTLAVLAGPDVVVLAGLRRPARVDVSVERPVRQVDAVDGVCQRLSAELVRRKPPASIPGAQHLARLRLRHLERQERLGPERVGHLLVGHELRRPAELAALSDLARVEYRDRLAALAAYRGLGGLPSHRRLREVRQRREQVVFSDDRVAAACLEGDGRLCPAERADERLLGRIPVRFGAARRAAELLSCRRDRGLGRRRRRLVLRTHQDSRRATGGTAAAASA